MTLPSLIADKKEKETVVKVKKFYSTMSNAFLLAQQENTELENWFNSDNQKVNAEVFFKNIKPYLSISKECGATQGCLTKGYVKNINGGNYHDYDNNPNEYRAVLADGTQFFVYMCYPNCSEENEMGNIKVDIDGLRGKYTFGHDVFIFNILKTGIVPMGVQGDLYTFEEDCNRAKSGYENGNACAAWVILNENMDYLRCDDLSWEGKTKCK